VVRPSVARSLIVATKTPRAKPSKGVLSRRKRENRNLVPTVMTNEVSILEKNGLSLTVDSHKVIINNRDQLDPIVSYSNANNNSNNGIDIIVDVNFLNNDNKYSYYNENSMNELFKRVNILKVFLLKLINNKMFIMGHIKRAMNKYIYKLNSHKVNNNNNMYSNNHNEPIAVLQKPSGLEVKELFYANTKLFGYGNIKLPVTSYPLKPDKILQYHRLVCEDCKDNYSEDNNCYIHTLLKCLRYGWSPPIDRNAIRPLYNVHGNYKTVQLFEDSCIKEVEDMKDNLVLIRSNDYIPGIINPLGAVVKNSDKLRAKTLVNINVTDQASLTLASETLIKNGYTKIKTRMATDMSATGVNRAALLTSNSSAPYAFSYPSFHDGINIIYRNCYLGKTDIGRYFLSFPLAFNVRDLFRVIFMGILYCFARCCFGFTLCPYYCSTWSAEFRTWILKLVGPCSHMVDDWLMAADTESEVRERISMLAAIFVAIGFTIAMEKNEYGQCITFLGFLLDTVNMLCRIDPVQAKGMKLQLDYYLKQIITGNNIDKSIIMSVAGKLNWYSEVVQSGRLHIKSWWDYHKYGNQMCDITKQRLVSDTCWWIELLDKWSQDNHSQLEYPIWSSAEILANDKSIYMIQSDASGKDGFGYFHGWLKDGSLSYVSKRWSDSGASRDHTKSHRDELSALSDFLNNNKGRIHNCILIWLTDSESGIYSINKGNCYSKDSLSILRIILELCDIYKLNIIGLWVPREENMLADYLSHLSYNLNRESIEGELSNLEGAPGIHQGV
jgi:hypothetical protein